MLEKIKKWCKKYNHMLIDFMQLKADILSTVRYDLGNLYFNDYDKKVLLKLNPFEARRIWNQLRYNILINDWYDLSFQSCPFCILNNVTEVSHIHKCVMCSYGKSRLTLKLQGDHICYSCIDKNSTYSYILKVIKQKNLNSSFLFSSRIYQLMITKIEEQ